MIAIKYRPCETITTKNKAYVHMYMEVHWDQLERTALQKLKKYVT